MHEQDSIKLHYFQFSAQCGSKIWLPSLVGRWVFNRVAAVSRLAPGLRPVIVNMAALALRRLRESRPFAKPRSSDVLTLAANVI